ncbi:MAG: sugar transferase [Flavobacteriales bacterium]|nr:sugar transferase [Flavobacteriales bacterium]
MLKDLKNILKETWIYFLLIGIFLLTSGYFISAYDQIEGHVLINQYYTNFWDRIFPYITDIGDGLTAIVIIIILFIWKEKYGYIALFAFLFTTTITHGLKFIVFPEANRPYLVLWDYFREGLGHTVLQKEDMKVHFSFPSGHTTSAMSIFCLLALIFAKQRKWTGILFAGLAILASFSRVYLSQHFVEDVFMGTIIGTLGTLIIFVWLDKRITQFEKGISLKRTFDLLFSLVVLVLGLPVFIVISIFVLLSGKGGIFFLQERIGLNKEPFKLLKFRTMRPNSEVSGQITVGGRDPRITRIGYFLRKFKLDEFPQIINILKGDMSVVGPRPEVKKYVDLYNEEQLKVLSVRPGLTDYASIEYMDENELLGKSTDPEHTYIEEIMPAKLQLNLKYIQEQSFVLDMKLVFKTFFGIFR